MAHTAKLGLRPVVLEDFLSMPSKCCQLQKVTLRPLKSRPAWLRFLLEYCLDDLRRNRPLTDFVFDFHSFLKTWSPDECLIGCVDCENFAYGNFIRSSGHVFATVQDLFLV
jgi:hypothetical protein